jgi:stage II sporulation protein D
MKQLLWLVIPMVLFSGCAEITPSLSTDYFIDEGTPNSDVKTEVENHPRIRVAIVIHQVSIHVVAPEYFMLSGFDFDGTPAVGQNSEKRFQEITLTPSQLYEKKAILTPMGDGQIEINGNPYRGSMEISKDSDGTLTVINDVDLEDYVMGVVAGEVPKNWPLEALKAQAIAARTFAVLKREEAREAGNPYDLENTALFQMYQGSGIINDNIQKAVSETSGEIITYNNKPIEAFFHSNCGGETSDAQSVWSQDLPYLQSVRCDYGNRGTHYRWQAEVLIPDLVRELRAAGMKIGDVVEIRPMDRDESGRIRQLAIVDSDGEIRNMKSSVFRMALGPDLIRSTNFKARVENDRVVFNGLGWGHGVGLCQEGACGMAMMGFNAFEILRYYYRGIMVETLKIQ